MNVLYNSLRPIRVFFLRSCLRLCEVEFRERILLFLFPIVLILVEFKDNGFLFVRLDGFVGVFEEYDFIRFLNFFGIGILLFVLLFLISDVILLHNFSKEVEKVGIDKTLIRQGHVSLIITVISIVALFLNEVHFLRENEYQLIYVRKFRPFLLLYFAIIVSRYDLIKSRFSYELKRLRYFIAISVGREKV